MIKLIHTSSYSNHKKKITEACHIAIYINPFNIDTVASETVKEDICISENIFHQKAQQYTKTENIDCDLQQRTLNHAILKETNLRQFPMTAEFFSGSGFFSDCLQRDSQ